MATRNGNNANTHLQEAMALLIRNQAAFVEQISRNDQERLVLQRQTDKWQRRGDERLARMEEWQRRGDERFARIEEWQRKSDERFARIEAQLVELPKRVVQTVLEQLPRIRKEIGFKTPR